MSGEPPILVLDDDPDVLALVRRILEHDGCRVETAADPREALAMIERERPSLLIVDLMLPRMDGEDFLRMVGSRFDPRPPVVVLSASAVRQEVVERTGAEASLAKPFQIEDLLDVVRRLTRAET